MHESFIPMPIAIHSNSNENAKIISIPQANAIYNQSFQFLFPLATGLPETCQCIMNTREYDCGPMFVGRCSLCFTISTACIECLFMAHGSMYHAYQCMYIQNTVVVVMYKTQ